MLYPIHNSCASRRGRISGPGLVLFGSIVAVLGLILVLALHTEKSPTVSPGGATSGTDALVVYCAAAAKGPIESIAKQFEKECGRAVQIQFGSSGSLLSTIELTRRGDLFLPADESYLQIARDKKLIAEVIPLAEMQAVVAVRKGNPKKIHTFDDLTAEGVRLAQGDPSTAIGKLTQETLTGKEKWEPLRKRTVVFKDTVNHVANDVLIGAVDAGIVWDATVAQYPGLEAVAVDEIGGVRSRVMVAVLQSTRRPTEALRLARYIGARDRGLIEMKKAGFTPAEGDLWAYTPEFKLFSGAMLRPAIEETIKQFEQREGVHITRVYDGCGLLVAEMKAGARPDAYFSCERSFMSKVSDLYVDDEDISLNRLMILVKKGNPLGIKTLADLGRPELRVGVGHEEKSAMGAITQNMLEATGMRDVVMKNVKVQLPTGDGLVNHLLAGSLDAIIAYRSNAMTAGPKVEALPIDVPQSLAIQPMAIGKESKFKQLAARLMATIKSDESRKRFESIGFQWRVGVK